MSVQQLAYLKLAFAMILVGGFIALNKMITTVFPIFLFSELRLGIAGIIFIMLLLWKEKKFSLPKGKDLLVLFFQSLVGVFLFSIFLLYGIRYTSAIESGIITSLTPAMVGVISYFILKEALNRFQISGIILAVAGTLSINIFGIASNATWSLYSLLGNLCILFAVFGEAVFVTFGKMVSSKISPLAISTIIICMGALMFLPLAIVDAQNFSFTEVTLFEWGLVFYSSVIVTVGAVLLMTQAVKELAGGSTAIFTAFMPISAVLVSYLFLGETIKWYHILGFSFVLCSIYLISKEKEADLPLLTSQQQEGPSQ